MGKPKLVQKIGDRSIFQLVTNALDDFESPNKVVVLGSNKELLIPQLPPEFKMIANKNWKDGLSSSIRTGMDYIEMNWPGLSHVLIVLGDMPLITSGYLHLLIMNLTQSGRGIIASNYGNSLGPPVIFSRKYFPELLRLSGDKGAKSIFNKHQDDVLSLDFPDGLIDIDTAQDLIRFRERSKLK